MSSMAIRPGQGALTAPTLKKSSAAEPTARATAREDNVEIKRARESENEANRRIIEAERRVQEQQRASEHKIEEMRDEYSEQMDVERSRQEGNINSERNEGTERVNELKRKQREELSSVKREGDRQLDQLQRHYRDTIYRTYQDGEKNLREQQSRQVTSQAHETQTSSLTQEQARQNHALQLEMMKDQHELQSTELNQNYRQELDRMRERTEDAKLEADNAFTTSYKDLSGRQQNVLDQLDQRTSRQLTTLREAHAERLAAYETRADDEFYRLRHMNASLEETEDAYIVRATIPEHERKNISVSVQGSTLTLTNQRRSQEALEPEPGRRQSSSSYQIITESFPLGMAVDARGVSRGFEGEEFVVRVPKKSTYTGQRGPAGSDPKTSKSPGRLKAERPQFPENLPVNQSEIARKVTESRLPVTPSTGRDRLSAAQSTSTKKIRDIPGSGTLS